MQEGARPSVVVVGSGVIGLAIAFELSGLGFPCTIVDPSPGQGASWAAAGMLSPAAELAPGEVALQGDLVDAARRWPSFASRVTSASGMAIGFERAGSLLVGASSSDSREVARLVALIEAEGASATPLSVTDVRRVEPTLAVGARGAWLLEDDHRVDNRLLVRALYEASKASGVRIIEDRCIGFEPTSRAVELVLEHQGRVHADRCVLATGASTPITGTSNLGLPSVRPVRGVTLRLSASPGIELPTRTVRGIVDGIACYLLSRLDGSLVIGATSEEQGDRTVAIAGGVRRLMDAAHRLFPGVDELVFDEAAVGMRPATDDHRPFVGALTDSRVIAALGHYRNGILLAPLAAAQVVALLEFAS